MPQPPPSPPSLPPTPSPTTPPSGSDSEEEDNPHLPIAGAKRTTQDLRVPGTSTAAAEDPVYHRRRQQHPMWPQAITKKGKMRDYEYNGAGWWLHVCNPDKPRAPLSLQDIQRLCEAIRKFNIVPIGIPAIAGIGVIQVRIGHAKGQGVVHFYTTRHGRSDGNARISIKNTSGLKTARTALLTSEWFHDAQIGAITPYNKKAEVIYEKEGKMILPPLHSTTPVKDLKSIFKAIRDNLGKKGKAAMKKYIADSGLQEQTEAMNLLRTIFKSDPEDEAKKTDPPDVNN